VNLVRSSPLLIVTITILDIIHRPVAYLKHNISGTGFYFRLQVEFIKFGPVVRVPETETSSIYWAQLSKFHLKTETEPNF
jgi:hypothetical protein